MAWKILLDESFDDWLHDQSDEVHREILAIVGILRQRGPQLTRPHADTLKGSSLRNLKELRIQIGGDPWRVLFVFDPERAAILLFGGRKDDDPKWYRNAIRIAEQRYTLHLADLSKRKPGPPQPD